MLDYSRKIKKMKIDFKIPEFLKDSIDRFVTCHNTDQFLLDCYQDELNSDINCCLHGDIPDYKLEEIRSYYIRGGMYDE